MQRYVNEIIPILNELELSSRGINTILIESSDTKSTGVSSESWLQDFYEENESEKDIQNKRIKDETPPEIVPHDAIEENTEPKDSEETEIATEDFLDDTAQEAIEVFFFSCRESITTIYKLLNKSLLSGEYISNPDIKSELDKIEDYLSTFSNNSIFLHLELQESVSEFVTAVNLGCLKYNIFIKTIENEYSSEKIDYMFSWNQPMKKEFYGTTLYDESIELLVYFAYNIDLSIYDHFFSSENNQFKQLFYIEKNIEESEILGFEKISNAIKLKLNFLKHKWKARKQQENPQSIHYSIDGNINTLEEYTPDNHILLDWSKLINSHYELYISNWKHETEKRIKPFKNKPLDSLTYLQIHQLIKYYKDVNKNYSKLSEIASYLKSKIIPDTESSYNKYAIDIISNYANNNKFSSFLEKKTEISSIKPHYLEAKMDSKGEINNFFLDYKYLIAIITILERKLDEVDNLTFLKEYEAFINEECENKINEYFKSIEWSKTNNNYIFLLPFEECQVDIPELNILDLPSIFIASSFILPAVNNHIDRQYEYVNQKVKNLVLQINSIKRIKKDLEDIQNLKSEIEKRDFKSIEIISIFTAIITFVLSSIPAYKFVQDVSESILFMFGLACALGIFVILILFATRGFMKNWVAYVYVGVLVIISIIGYNAILKDEKTEVIIKKEIDNRIDSLAIKKVDSILASEEIKKQKK